MLNVELTKEESEFINVRVKAFVETLRTQFTGGQTVQDVSKYLRYQAEDVAQYVAERLYRQKGKDFVRRYCVAVLDKMLELEHDHQ